MKANVTSNIEKNGIEIRFDGKPDAIILQNLKSNGFRWSNNQKMWYAKRNDDVMKFVHSIDMVFSDAPKNNTKNFNLWQMTRTNDIPDNFDLYRIYDTKEIASIIRKHIRPRFPMCKFSVTSSHSSIDIELLASPFGKDSDEVSAILHYVHEFAESYNYDNSDLMSDYFDNNFYLGGEYSMVSYRYNQTEADESIDNISSLFHQSKAEFEENERLRKEREYQEYLEQAAKEREQAEIRKAQEKINHDKIEDSVRVVDLENGYFLSNLLSPLVNKLNCVSEIQDYIEREEFGMELCHVTREVYMDSKTYELFQNMLLNDYSFLAGMGGSATYDNRITSMIDFEHMTEDERNTVEWYCCKCVAIYCDNVLTLVCDPQGHNYARYTFIPGDKTEKADDHAISQVVSDEQLEEYKFTADELEDLSANIILENGLVGSWDTTAFGLYRKAMVQAIHEYRIRFNVNIIRAIPAESSAFKCAMYRILEIPAPIEEQFEDAKFLYNEEITILSMDDMLGGIQCSTVKFRGFESCAYAGRKGVKMVMAVPRKSGEYYRVFTKECIVVRGAVSIPRSLFWEPVESHTGLRCERTKFLSFDRKQFDATLDYLRSIKADIAVNTYKPIF